MQENTNQAFRNPLGNNKQDTNNQPKPNLAPSRSTSNSNNKPKKKWEQQQPNDLNK